MRALTEMKHRTYSKLIARKAKVLGLDVTIAPWKNPDAETSEAPVKKKSKKK